MRNYKLKEFHEELIFLIGKENVITDQKRIRLYSKGIRIGQGSAAVVAIPKNLIDFWHILELSITFDKVIIIQAANTGLTGGSTPDGNDYDRDVIIISTLLLNQLIIANKGNQVIAFPGTTLYQLEDQLLPFSRGPHSVIGSSCIGASVIGGICNNSGGNLVKRGPAYTELSLFARVGNNGKLELVNHLDIDLGNDPVEILSNLESSNFDKVNLQKSNKYASDCEYHQRIRDVASDTPSRFNSDQRRLYESSGSAGKIAVFAVRLDTFPLPQKEQVFFVGTNDPKRLTQLRKNILIESKTLPDMGEYMHKSYFEASLKYCKDTFLFIKFLGTKFLPKLIRAKRIIDDLLQQIFFLPNGFADIILQFIASLFPLHLSSEIIKLSNRYEHYMIFLASDSSIEPLKSILESQVSLDVGFEYIECDDIDGKDLLLHRFVAGAAPARFSVLNNDKSNQLLPLDIALPRNCDSWHEILPFEVLSKMEKTFQMGHFLCMVFHWDFVVKKNIDVEKLKDQILQILDENKAKYPAEHNVGHLYKAEQTHKDFFRSLDPTNTFNPGLGKDSKNKNYK